MAKHSDKVESGELFANTQKFANVTSGESSLFLLLFVLSYYRPISLLII